MSNLMDIYFNDYENEDEGFTIQPDEGELMLEPPSYTHWFGENCYREPVVGRVDPWGHRVFTRRGLHSPLSWAYMIFNANPIGSWVSFLVGTRMVKYFDRTRKMGMRGSVSREEVRQICSGQKRLEQPNSKRPFWLRPLHIIMSVMFFYGLVMTLAYGLRWWFNGEPLEPFLMWLVIWVVCTIIWRESAIWIQRTKEGEAATERWLLYRLIDSQCAANRKAYLNALQYAGTNQDIDDSVRWYEDNVGECINHYRKDFGVILNEKR